MMPALAGVSSGTRHFGLSENRSTFDMTGKPALHFGCRFSQEFATRKGLNCAYSNFWFCAVKPLTLLLVLR